jgi:nitroreductase
MTMEALQALTSRESVSPRHLGGPAPSAAEREVAFKAAMTAPDHGALRPWRFLVVEGEGLQRLGEVFAEAARRANPGADPAVIESAREKALRSPLLIVAAAVVKREGTKIPEIEQIIATGCATQNLLNAFHAQGYGAMLVTGDRAYDAGVKRALGLDEKDHIVAFMHVGTPTGERSEKKKVRAEVAHHVRSWPG